VKLFPQYSDHISTTELMGIGRKSKFQKAFDHSNCPVLISERQNIIIRDDQGLRNLRHRLGHMDNPHVASCPHCGREFTYENLVGLCANCMMSLERYLTKTKDGLEPRGRCDNNQLFNEKSSGAYVSN
jgi:hypothetical protein